MCLTCCCALQLTLAQQASEEAAWRQQVNQVHQQLLDQQKHKAALRQRLQQDAQRAKREQLRRIEPVAKARARANGLASLGLDPEIMALSEKFGRLSGLVDEVQQRMEAEYGLMGSMDDQAAYGRLPPSPAAAGTARRSSYPDSRLAAGKQQRLRGPAQVQQPPQTWPGQQQQPERVADWHGPKQQMLQQTPLQQQQHNGMTRMPNSIDNASAAPSSPQQPPLQASPMQHQPAQQSQQAWQQQPVVQSGEPLHSRGLQ